MLSYVIQVIFSIYVLEKISAGITVIASGDLTQDIYSMGYIFKGLMRGFD